MDGCKNVSISHTLPGGRYASVADSQCGQLGEFHTNLVIWTQLSLEKINSYFITVVYKKKFHKMHVHHIAGVSMASPAIAISSDTFNCPCFVDCSSTCDTGLVSALYCNTAMWAAVHGAAARMVLIPTQSDPLSISTIELDTAAPASTSQGWTTD